MIRNKMKSRTGATILLAILFFLMCSFAGTTVLAASSVASGRIVNLKEQEQNYYSVISAATTVRDELNHLDISVDLINGAMTGEELFEEPEFTEIRKDKLENTIADVFLEGMSKITSRDGPDDSDFEKPMSLTIWGNTDQLVEGFRTVKMNFIMDVDYNVGITFYQVDSADSSKNDSTYQCTIKLSSNVNMTEGLVQVTWPSGDVLITKDSDFN